MFSLSNPPFCMPIPRPRGGGARGDTCISSNQAALYFRKKKKLTTLPNRCLFHVPIRGLTFRASCSTPVETHNFHSALSLSNDHPLCGPNDAGMNITCGTDLQYWKNGSHTLGNMFTPPNHPFCRPRGGLFTCLAGRSASAKSRRAKNKIESKKKEAFDKKKAERKAEKAEKKRKKKGGGKTVIRVVKKVMKIGKKKKKTAGKMGASKKRKRNQVLFKLVSTADTNFHYLTSKNRKNHPGKKINLRKYDPVVRRHVQFVETKM